MLPSPKHIHGALLRVTKLSFLCLESPSLWTPGNRAGQAARGHAGQAPAGGQPGLGECVQDQKGSEPCVELRVAACGQWEIPGA